MAIANSPSSARLELDLEPSGALSYWCPTMHTGFGSSGTGVTSNANEGSLIEMGEAGYDGIVGSKMFGDDLLKLFSSAYPLPEFFLCKQGSFCVELGAFYATQSNPAKHPGRSFATNAGSLRFLLAYDLSIGRYRDR